MFAIMLTGGIVFTLLGWNIPTANRIFHYLSATMLFISSICYFSMAAYAQTLIQYSKPHLGDDLAPLELLFRILEQQFWIRLHDTLASFVIVVVMLGMVARMDAASLFAAVVAAVITVVAGCMTAAFHSEAENFGW